jgi:hypothetical protein
VKNTAGLLAAALNERATITENGKRRQVPQAQGGHRSAGQQIGLGRSAEHRKKGGAGSYRENPFDPTDKAAVQSLRSAEFAEQRFERQSDEACRGELP